MVKKISILILLLSSFSSFSQEVITSIPLALKKDRDVFQIVNNFKQETSLFISDKKSVKAIRLNDKIQVLDSLSTERPDKKFSEMIGYNIDQGNPRLFWSSSDHEEIYSQLYDFSGHKILNKNYSLPLKDEKYIQNFSENDKFYILSVVKRTDSLKLYVFDAKGKLEEKIIHLTGMKFFTFNYQRTNVYGVLRENLLPFEAPFSLPKITTDSPTSLTQSAKKRKCYSNEKQIILTFDTNNDYTQLVIIDLNDYQATGKIITKPYINYTERSELNSNSFLIDKKIFQVKLNREKLIVAIKDLNDKPIKEYLAEGKLPIDFKNSEIYEVDHPNNKIIKKTSQFIRKVNNSNPGISCCQIDDNYLVTIGCVSEQQQNSSIMIGGMIGGFAGALIAAAITNPTYNSFNSYTNRNVAYIDCLFDKDANHINAELKPLAVDKMKIFLENNK